MLTMQALTIVLALPASGADVLIADVPHVKQKPDFCGEACAEMFLRKLGSSLDQDDVFDQSGVDPIEGRGCRTKELARALERIGFDVGGVWGAVRPSSAVKDLEREWSSLLADLAAGVPSIVCMRTSRGPDATEHFRLVLGYEAGKDLVVYHEPAEEGGAYRTMPRSELLELWPLKYESSRWLAVRLRLRPAETRAKHSEGLTSADYAQHARTLRARLPSSGFTLVVSPPFVVAGDEDAATVRRRARSTVEWAVARLKKQFFAKEPAEVIDIWLFRDKASYEKNALALFGSRPTTPFGWYSAEHRALVMDISTGGGTLVHEIVHPFMHASFPACPAWFNEGLASLFEQSAERGGRIVGLTNWRLAGLQEALRAGRIPRFRQLLATTEHEFYRRDPGTNYAQARYLCHYLQEKSLLEEFFHELVRAAEEDPTGYEALKKVLRRSDAEMTAFEEEWGKYVLSLRFGG